MAEAPIYAMKQCAGKRQRLRIVCPRLLGLALTLVALKNYYHLSNHQLGRKKNWAAKAHGEVNLWLTKKNLLKPPGQLY